MLCIKCCPFLLAQCFDVQMQVIRLRGVNTTHSENLIQYKNLKNKILAAFDIFGVFTQFKFLIQLRLECLNKVIHLADRKMMAASLK